MKISNMSATADHYLFFLQKPNLSRQFLRHCTAATLQVENPSTHELLGYPPTLYATITKLRALLSTYCFMFIH